MNPINTPDRESRFQDACKLAAAVVVVGLIVVTGEAAMHRAPMLGGEAAAAAAFDVGPSDYFPHQYSIEASEPEPHVEAF